MELAEITQVAELTRVQDVNKYLDLGWHIIKVYTTAYDTEGPGCNHQSVHFVMAWTGADPQYPEEPSVPGVTVL